MSAKTRRDLRRHAAPRRPRTAGLARFAILALAALVPVAPGFAGAQDQQPPDQPPVETQQDESEQPATRPTTAPATTLPSTGPAPTRNGANGANGQGITRADGGLVINFRDASIDVVLDELSDAAGLIIVREAKPTGRVTLTSRQPVSPEDAVVLLNTVLHNAGYAAIRQGKILKIVESARAKKLNIPVRSGRDPTEIEPTDELITQVIPLRHADAVQLKTDLQPLINPDADFTSNASSNALVLTDTAANVRRIVEIIAALDMSLADSVDVRVFQLEYATAATAAELINSIFGELEFGPGGGGEDGGDRERIVRMMMQRGRGEGGQPAGQGARGARVNAAADDRTNMLVVTGPVDTLEIVADVIKQIDENPIADETVFVYRLRNAQAANVEAVLNNLFGNPLLNAFSRNAAGGAGGGQNQLQNLQRNRGGNVRGGGGGATGGRGGLGGGGGLGGQGGGGQNQQRAVQQQMQQQMQLQQMQQQMQRQQQGGGGRGGGGRLSRNAQQTLADLAGQVTIIADADTNSLLVRTNPQNYERVRAVLEELDRPVAQVLIKVLIAEVTHDRSVDLGTELSVLNLRASGLGQEAGTNFNIPTEGAAATGLVVQVLEQDFTAAVRALETAGKLDVLSRPYILASDNQLASITVGQEVPFVTNSRITDEGGIINTIEYGDIGILLDVVPHINPDGLVILDVAPEISTLTGTTVPISELVNAPVIAKRSALSRVGVKNGQTIVIGGLMEDRKTQTINKVPILGDIPLIGNAFKRTQQTKVKTELLIFLTPHVASNPDLLDEMRDEEMDGTELVPNAVERGAFREHMRGLQRGNTQGAEQPDTQPSDFPLRDPQQDQQQPGDRPRDGRRRGGDGGSGDGPATRPAGAGGD